MSEIGNLATVPKGVGKPIMDCAMKWFLTIYNVVRAHAVQGERLERLSNTTDEMDRELKDLDRRVSRLEGAYAMSRLAAAPPQQVKLPSDNRQ